MKNSEFDDKHTRYKPLARKVLAVAIQGDHGVDWAAYIDAVVGVSFRKEWEKVARDGSKLPYEIARILFPEFDNLYEWRT